MTRCETCTIFALISSESYLKSVLSHSQTGKSKLEVLLAKDSIGDLPGKSGESLILEVQTWTDDKNQRRYRASVKGAMIVKQLFENADPTFGKRPADEDEAKEWFENHYKNFGWDVEAVSNFGSTWTGFLSRYYGHKDLVEIHGQLLGGILDRLQNLVR